MTTMTIYTLNALMNHGGGVEDPELYTNRGEKDITFEEALIEEEQYCFGNHVLTPYERKFMGME